MIELLNSFSELFSDSPSRTDLIGDDVGDADPVKQCFYLISTKKHAQHNTEVQHTLDNNTEWKTVTNLVCQQI